MAANNISYPHPVLGNGDDIAIGNVSPDVEYEISDEVIHLSIENLATGHSEIDDMVEANLACWHLRIQCSRTYMRQSFLLGSGEQKITLNGQDYEGLVSIDISIVARKDIPAYQPSGIHADYENAEFSLRPGELIAVGPTYQVHIDKVYDPLKAPVASLVRITEGDHKEGPLEVTLDDDLITIRLSKTDWNEYAGIRDRAPSVIHSSIIFPVLMEAIRTVDQYSDTLWGGRIKEILGKEGIDQSLPFIGAQKILASPVSRTFGELNVKLDRVDA